MVHPYRMVRRPPPPELARITDAIGHDDLAELRRRVLGLHDSTRLNDEERNDLVRTWILEALTNVWDAGHIVINEK